ARVEGEPVCCTRRLVFDRAGRALNRPEARVFSDQWAEQTVYVTAPAFAARVPAAWRARGVEVWDDVLTWEILRARLLECGLTGLYVEGGAGLLSDLLRARELDYLFAYRGAQWLGDVAAPGPFAGFETPTMDGAWRLEAPQHASFGSDQLFHGRVVYPPVS
ncbi:MAG: RibD family protein, partial [Verrucomicrobiota bacterium]